LERSGRELIAHFKKKMIKKETIKIKTTRKLTKVLQMMLSMIPHSKFSQRIIEGLGGFEAQSWYLFKNLFFDFSIKLREFSFFLHKSLSSISSKITNA